MKSRVTRITSFLAAGLMATAVWAAESPIGSLTVKGAAKITSQDTSFTIQDQEYAYFSGDRIATKQNGEAYVTTSDGLRIGLPGASVVTVTRDGSSYSIALEKGNVAVDASDGVEYQITHDGEALSAGEEIEPSGTSYVASVKEGGEAELYMPAQTGSPNALGGVGLTPEWLALFFGGLAAAGGGGDGGGGGDDLGPSS